MSYQKNIIWTFAGLSIPVIFGAIAVPFLLSGYGVTRFGLLTIAYAIIGYASIFDMGLSRAVTRSVSIRINRDRLGEIPSVVSFSRKASFLLGCLSFIGLWAIQSNNPGETLKYPPHLQDEVSSSFLWLAIGMPILMISSLLRGIHEAFSRFQLISSLRIFQGIANFGIPLSLLSNSKDVSIAISALVGARFLTWIIYELSLNRILHNLPNTICPPQTKIWKEIFSQSSWITLSGILSPLMISADRFLIAAIIGSYWVAYYTTPLDTMIQALIIPSAFSSVAYSEFCRDLTTNKQSLKKKLAWSQRTIFIIMGPLCLLAFFSGPDLMSIWTGPEFASKSGFVSSIIAVGIFFNSLAVVPYGLIQAAGRADVTAKIHICEFPLYAATAVIALHAHGIIGLACVWSMRMAIDYAAMTLFSRQLLSSMQNNHIEKTI